MNSSWPSCPVERLSTNIFLIFMLFFSFCLAKKEKGPWTLPITNSFSNEFTITSVMNPCSQTDVFLFHPYPSHTPSPGALGLNLGYLSRAQGLLNLFGLFLVMKTSQMQLLIVGKVQDMLSTSGLTGNKWFLPAKVRKSELWKPTQAQQYAN